MEKRAVAKYIKIAPKKVCRVADLIRGKNVEIALNELHFLGRKITRALEKTLRSAVANLMNDKGASNIDTESLFIKDIIVNKGPMLKRYRPRSMGRADVIAKRTSHITMVISDE